MTRAMAAGAALIALLLTSACGGDSSASPTPSPSRSPSPTATSTTPTPPALPAAATKNTKAGAIAFVRHYVELINYAQATGDVAALRRASSPECVSCQQAIDAIVDLYGSGGFLEGGDWEAGKSIVARNSRGWLVTARVTYGRQEVHRQGKATTTLPGGPHTLNFTIQTSPTKVLRWTRAS